MDFFEGGRVEEFLLARTLTTEEFPQFIVTLGQKIANMHHCEMDLDRNPQIFENLFLWLDNARSISFRDPNKKALHDTIDFSQLEIELTQLKTRLLNL